METVAGIFTSRAAAEQAVREINALGIAERQNCVVDAGDE